jgi:hypothetical protein
VVDQPFVRQEPGDPVAQLVIERVAGSRSLVCGSRPRSAGSGRRSNGRCTASRMGTPSRWRPGSPSGSRSPPCSGCRPRRSPRRTCGAVASCTAGPTWTIPRRGRGSICGPFPRGPVVIRRRR